MMLISFSMDNHLPQKAKRRERHPHRQSFVSPNFARFSMAGPGIALSVLLEFVSFGICSVVDLRLCNSVIEYQGWKI
jgi:hypothetical protein